MRNCRRLWSSDCVPPMGSIELATAVVIKLLGTRPGRDGLGDNADVVDAGLAKGVDDGGETPEGNGFVAAEEDAFLRVFQVSFDPQTELVNIGGLIAEVDALSFVHGDDEALLIDFLHGPRFGDVDFDARLENRGGD